MNSPLSEKAVVDEGPVRSNTTSEDERRLDSTDSVAPMEAAAQRQLIRKCDIHVIPVLSILYTLAFIDRINIGNARIQGLEKDLHMKGTDYNIALFIFFIPYILFEVPSNILIRKVAPSTWLSAIMLCWGIVTICMGVTRSYAGLLVCRFLLGLFEAGFFPGCVYLISMYYKRYELQWRFNLFFGICILSGAWSGLLAYAIAKMDGIRGYGGWRWIFIIEGLLTTVIAIVAIPFIPNWPETAKFLNAQERKLLLQRLSNDNNEAQMDTLDHKARKRIFSDWKMYLGMLMYFGIVTTGYSTSFFTPTILSQLGWTSVRAQVLSIPIYVLAAAVSLFAAYWSDHFRHRYTFVILGVLVATTGYITLLAQSTVSVAGRYIAIYLIMVGGYITQPITLVWLNNNMGGHYKRSINAAMQIGFGNLGGIVASNIFITTQRPKFVVGYSVALALLWLCAGAATVLVWGMKRENGRRDRGERDARLRLEGEEVRNLGDDHPRFRYGY